MALVLVACGLSAFPGAGQPVGDLRVTADLLILDDGPLFLTPEQGEIDGIGFGPVKFLRRELNDEATAMPRLGRPLDAGDPAMAPLWCTSRAHAQDLVIVGDTTARVHLLASAQTGADLSVLLLEVTPEGELRPLADAAVPLQPVEVGPRRLDVTLPVDGLRLGVGHALCLGIEFEAETYAAVLRYGNEDAPAGLGRLVLAASDRDGDGLGDTHESRAFTDPFVADTDGDGVSDGDEAFLGGDPRDADARPDTWQDTDGDGLADAAEPYFGTRRDAADTDGDGFGDGLEARQGRDPREPLDHPVDRDGDGLPDLTETRMRLDAASSDTDADGIADGAEDLDGDGLANVAELGLGTDPLLIDTNGDGVSDGEALRVGRHPLALPPATSGPQLVGPASFAVAGAALTALVGTLTWRACRRSA